MVLWAVALVLLGPAAGFSQSESDSGQGQAVVTVLPKHDGVLPASVTGQDLSVKINGKRANVTAWKPFQSPANSLELVVLIDSSARTSLGSQFSDIDHFIKGLPPNTKAAIAYMQFGRAVLAGVLSADHAQVLCELHLTGGAPGSSASPYFCLSDLAAHWPSEDRAARREVLMVTDGVDNYETGFDPENTYVQTAIRDSVRARLVIYSIYWQNRGRSSTPYETNTGQSYLNLVAEATGGKSFSMGTGNPVSFQPFLDELTRRFRNQYEIGFTTGLTGKAEVEPLKLTLHAPGTEVDAPQQVFVFPVSQTQKQ